MFNEFKGIRLQLCMIQESISVSLRLSLMKKDYASQADPRQSNCLFLPSWLCKLIQSRLIPLKFHFRKTTETDKQKPSAFVKPYGDIAWCRIGVLDRRSLSPV